MKVVGITGGTGAGKTTLLNYFKTLGARIIDCDAVYHDLLENSDEMKNELELRFPGIIKEGGIDRKELGNVVFNDTEALSDLNEITHKFVGKEVQQILNREKNNGREIVAIDAILLIESGIANLCNRVAGIIAPKEKRLKRIMQRDKIDEKYALARICAQKPDSFFIDNCDIILENDFDDVDDFYSTCAESMERLLKDISKEEEY